MFEAKVVINHLKSLYYSITQKKIFRLEYVLNE